MIATKKEKGINLVKTFDSVKIEQVKKVANAWPSSVTRSRKFTDWTVQTIAARANRVMKKNLENS